MKISIIIPVLNEAETVLAFLQPLQVLREHGHEIILADGKSNDLTCDIARPYVDKIIMSAKGRAKQQIAGALVASGQVLLFLHADTLLPVQADKIIIDAIKTGYLWGRFDVCLSGRKLMFRVIERAMNLRSCLTGVATGDQAIFVLKEHYEALGGMPDIVLMEDIALSKRLRKVNRPFCCKSAVITSSRRWEEKGIMSTILLMWSLRLQFFFGVKPETLLKKYYP